MLEFEQRGLISNSESRDRFYITMNQDRLIMSETGDLVDNESLNMVSSSSLKELTRTKEEAVSITNTASTVSKASTAVSIGGLIIGKLISAKGMQEIWGMFNSL